MPVIKVDRRLIPLDAFTAHYSWLRNNYPGHFFGIELSPGFTLKEAGDRLDSNDFIFIIGGAASFVQSSRESYKRS